MTLPRLLIVHSSADLYGSDRSLLDFLRCEGQRFDVTVLVPEQGPLIAELRVLGVRVEIGEVGKVQRAMLSHRGLLRMVRSLWRCMRLIRRLAAERRFDLIYTNTAAVFGGAIYAYFARCPHVWHVREILEDMPRLSAAYRAVIGSLSTSIVCNSNQTMGWIATPRSRSKCLVIWNGVATPAPLGVRAAERERLGYGAQDLVFALVGRLNAIKGQALAIEALERLHAQGLIQARLLIVGSAYHGQEHFERALRERIAASPVASAIRLETFRPDVEAVWECADVVLVPSTAPESFGRVAVEAMSFARPVVAAAHGGLLDIVVHEESGLLVPPRDAAQLAAAMHRLCEDADLRGRLGQAARSRHADSFSVSSYASRLRDALLGVLPSVSR